MDLYKAHSPFMGWRGYIGVSLSWCAILLVIVVFLEGGTFYQFLRECLLSLIGLTLGLYLFDGRRERNAQLSPKRYLDLTRKS